MNDNSPNADSGSSSAGQGRSSFSLNSSNLSEMDYEPNRQTLTISFNSGAQYEYYGVPPQVAEGLRNASSPGQYFFRLIKNQYRYQRV